MPVVIVLSTIALLAGGSPGEQPFFNPAVLKAMLARGLRNAPAETRDDAMRLAQQLEDILKQYRLRVLSGIDAYVESASAPQMDLEQLNQTLSQLDEERAALMQQIIGIRARLVERLTKKQWNKVFG